MTHQAILQFSTRGRGTLDITEAVARAVAQASIQVGLPP
jgi:thiamine phosphate synthase YjbQ (UPF0047 family)